MSGIGVIITIIVVVIWVVKALSAVTGNGESSSSQSDKGRSLEEWDQVQANRRAEMAERARQGDGLEDLEAQALANAPQQTSMPDPSQMTMAQRIELARQQARQHGDPAEALRQQARARAEQEAQRRQGVAQQQQAQRERVERQRAEQARERQLAERRRAKEQRAQAEREQLEQRSRRRKSGSKTKRTAPRQPATPTAKPSQIKIDSMRRVHQGHDHAGPTLSALPKKRALSATSLGKLNAASLRKAFIMKELLDKPIALRSTQDELLS